MADGRAALRGKLASKVVSIDLLLAEDRLMRCSSEETLQSPLQRSYFAARCGALQLASTRPTCNTCRRLTHRIDGYCALNLLAVDFDLRENWLARMSFGSATKEQCWYVYLRSIQPRFLLRSAASTSPAAGTVAR